LPIIAPAIGPFPTLIRDTAGIAYDASGANGLRDALEQTRLIDRDESRDSIDSYLAGITWAKVGGQHGEMYRRISGMNHVGI